MIGDEVEVGCGSILNPGSVIGKNTNIYPLSSVRGVVAENSIYKNKNEIIERIYIYFFEKRKYDKIRTKILGGFYYEESKNSSYSRPSF